jgi:hypothetical protein
MCIAEPEFVTFREPRNRFQEIDSAGLVSLVGRYFKLQNTGCRTGRQAGNRFLGSLKGLQIRVLNTYRQEVDQKYAAHTVCKTHFIIQVTHYARNGEVKIVKILRSSQIYVSPKFSIQCIILVTTRPVNKSNTK